MQKLSVKQTLVLLWHGQLYDQGYRDGYADAIEKLDPDGKGFAVTAKQPAKPRRSTKGRLAWVKTFDAKLENCRHVGDEFEAEHNGHRLKIQPARVTGGAFYFLSIDGKVLTTTLSSSRARNRAAQWAEAQAA